ncbi:MAG: UMP kinase, partial [Candidatus Cloacimonetes bacterium]|nr:UMP kinase [Candidatus Cloacimonadota bacterium]
YYTYQDVDTAMKNGILCLLCGGTGNPFFTTDTTAILRAIELDCDMVLKGTMVDGIYTADPKKDKNAKFIKQITYSEALDKQLRIMDMTAFSLARDYKIPIIVFDINTRGNIVKALLSDEIGTLVFE